MTCKGKGEEAGGRGKHSLKVEMARKVAAYGVMEVGSLLKI